MLKRGVPWAPTDQTGGPLDDVFATLRQAFADLKIERITVTHPTDDDNVWFLTRGGREDSELQVDSLPHGQPPFLLESDAERAQADEAETATEILSAWLRK